MNLEGTLIMSYKRVSLFRDHSELSEQIEILLIKHDVPYARFFEPQIREPVIITSHGEYKGINGANQFMRVFQRRSLHKC